MDWLAEILVKNYEARIDDPAYIAGKRAELSEKDRLGSMRAISALDKAGRELLCKDLDVTEADMVAFLRVLRVL